MSMRGLIFAVAAAALIGGVAAPAAARDVRFGPRFNVSDDADLGVGADVRWTFLAADPRLAVTASFDYFFPEDGNEQIDDAFGEFHGRLPVDLLRVFDFRPATEVEYWETNLNLTWDFTADHPVVPYAGVGVTYGRAKASFARFDTDDGDVGANVLAGIRIQRRFYVEAKQEAGGGELFVLTVGVRF
jgi:opacity protein-like surface antigen